MEGVFAILLLVGAGWDIACRRLPNWLTLAIGIAFVPWAMAMGIGAPGFLSAALAGGISFGLGFALFQFRLMGAGDVKLIVAVALWIGLSVKFVRFILYMGVAGGILALLFLALRRVTKRGVGELPYGVAIAIAALIVWVNGTTCFVH